MTARGESPGFRFWEASTADLRAPRLRVSRWIQGAPADASWPWPQAVVLLDFWDYSCINCLRTLPVVQGWQTRYGAHGLQVVGVHAPEFAFAAQEHQVAHAVQRLGLTYPVALDHQFQTWQAYGVRAWPTQCLIDAQGRIRAMQQGEGDPGVMEAALRACLNPEQTLPPPVWRPRPARGWQSVGDGDACRPAIREAYLGWGRGRVCNPQGLPREQTVWYAHAPETAADRHAAPALQGGWQVGKEALISVIPAQAGVGNLLESADVQWAGALSACGAVLENTTPGGSPVWVSVQWQDSPVPSAYWGEDLMAHPERGQETGLWVAEPRWYALLRPHTDLAYGCIRLRVAQSGLAVYTLTAELPC